MPEWFRLSTPQELFSKLQHDAEHLTHDPTDAYRAFNFVVTAFHLLDWAHPGDAGKEARTALRHKEPLLQVLAHLANGVKHFKLNDPKLDALRGAGGAPSWAEAPRFNRQLGSRVVNRRVLHVRLQGEAARSLGDVLSVTDLAQKAVAFWDQQLRGAPGPDG